MRRRLDAELVRRGLLADEQHARAAIEQGVVSVAGVPSPKPSTLVGPQDPVRMDAESPRFVSRGGDKLDGALDRLGLDPRGRDALDAGASTGGFTDVLLQRGAARVISVDVGYGQLAWRVRTDPRVSVLERTNVSDLRSDLLPFAPQFLVADLSFIGLAAVIPALVRVATDDAEFVVLVKPQFEAPRSGVGPGGVVRDPAVWERAIETVARAFANEGFACGGVVVSTVPGPAGNVEFVLAARRDGPDVDLGEAVRDATREARTLGGAA